MMNSYNLMTSRAFRVLFIGVVFLSISAGVALDVVAQGVSGFVSTNPADLPPNMGRDVASQSVNPDQPPAYGPEDAKVLVIIFADYKCPACRRASQSTHQVAAEFPGDVRMEFWNHPLASHRNADLAAAAGVAAQQQGKFWEMHDILFENSKHDMATLEQHAQDLGLDLEQFRADMNDPAVKERISNEGALTEALGAPNTPSYLVNGKVYMGWGSWRSMRGKVERELKAVNALAGEGLSASDIRAQRALDNYEDSETYEIYRLAVIEPRIAAKNK
jgi:protein-disulfide isomerase